MQAYIFEPVSQWVVVGSNPEMADIDNPRGHIFGLSYAVRARNERGDTWELPVATGSLHDDAVLAERTTRVATALQARLDRLGKLPVGFAQWQQGRAVYGSEAYVAYGADDELAMERREADEEMWG